ncbi:hypothetical protein DKX38_026398 [Salix brachista]|uniref:Uncharacterized protein n=1 Tax=Salix brachista TaxID=2182728 RepID=A0A5N5JDJ8_9ROSI|nr:hypothetical protein DKX38_026398 [Salix brachista]
MQRSQKVIDGVFVKILCCSCDLFMRNLQGSKIPLFKPVIPLRYSSSSMDYTISGFDILKKLSNIQGEEVQEGRAKLTLSNGE